MSKSIIFNYNNYAMLIPVRCLKWLNRPKYIEIFISDKRSDLVIHGISKEWEERLDQDLSKKGTFTDYFIVPQDVYDNKDCYYGIDNEAMPNLMEQINEIMKDKTVWNVDKTYSMTGRIDNINNLAGYEIKDMSDLNEADKEKLVRINFEEAEDFEGEIDEELIFVG